MTRRALVAALVAATGLSAPVAAAKDAPVGHAAKVTNAKSGTSARPVRGGGAVLRWRTTREQGNVGFILYRARKATPKKRTTLLPRMVAGTVLKFGKTRVIKQGRTYARVDLKGKRGDRYWIKDVDVSGKTRLRGPYVVKGKAVKRPRNSPLLPADAKTKKPGAAPSQTGSVPVAPPSPVIPPGTPPQEAQALLASRQTVRLGVDTTGWTRVDLATLQNRGIDTSKPANLHLFTGGVEVAAVIRNDGLEFYGEAVDALDTGTRAYFVDAELGPGRRAATAAAATTAPAGPTSFDATALRDARGIYFSGLRNGEASNFFGDVVGGTAKSIAVATPNLASADGARLTVTMQGLTTNDHAVAVSLNGSPVGTISYSGQTSKTQSFDVGGLAGGSNTVRLAGAASSDVSLTGAITLRYVHGMTADADSAAPAVPGGRRVRIDGFSGAARVVDVTDTAAPIVVPEAADGDAVRATAPGDGTRQLLAFGPNAVRAPATVNTGFPSTLKAAANDGTLTIITPDAYQNAVGPLVQQRRAEGMSVKVVVLQDIYDEFSFGQADHNAVTAMLANARSTWRSPPRYVLLGGDGTYDPRGFESGKDGRAGNVVPTALIDTEAESPSDSTLTGTLATGRLPARSPDQMVSLVAKVLRYGAQPSTSSSVLFSDLNDTWNFTGSNDQLKPLLPPTWGVNQIQRSAGDARAQLLAGLNAGPSVVNYAGHGSVDFWRGDTLKASDATGLTNANLSFYVLMTCLNGYFADPSFDSLAEAFVRAPNGAIAVFSSTGTTTPGPQEQANQALFSALFAGAPPRLGDAIVASLSATGDEDVRRTWTLMGDPTLVIH